MCGHEAKYLYFCQQYQSDNSPEKSATRRRCDRSKVKIRAVLNRSSSHLSFIINDQTPNNLPLLSFIGGETLLHSHLIRARVT